MAIWAKVSIFFSREKILSHSLTPFRDLPRKFRLCCLGRWTSTKTRKKLYYELVSKKYKFTPCHWIFLSRKWWSRIFNSYFFFRENWERKKNTPIFTHSLLFRDFHPKSNFLKEIKIRHLRFERILRCVAHKL